MMEKEPVASSSTGHTPPVVSPRGMTGGEGEIRHQGRADRSETSVGHGRRRSGDGHVPGRGGNASPPQRTTAQDKFVHDEATIRHHSGPSNAPEEAVVAPPPQSGHFLLMDPTSEPRTYRLIIRQSPLRGQMCTLGSKERRILDPLPIVQLDLRTKDGRRDLAGQTSPFLVMQVHLIAQRIDVKGKSTAHPTSQSEKLGESSASSATPQSSTGPDPMASSSGAETSAGPSTGTPIPGAVQTNAPVPPRRPLLPPPHDTAFSAIRLLEGKLTASAQIVHDVEHYLDRLEREEELMAAALTSTPEGAVEQPSATVGSIVPPASVVPPTTSSRKDRSRSLSTPVKTEDADDRACLFVFTDLSIRMRGTYRLHFSLLKLEPSQTRHADGPVAGKVVATAITDPFPVLHVRHFPGMLESTPLAKSLAAQGIHIPIRNEPRRQMAAAAAAAAAATTAAPSVPPGVTETSETEEPPD